jgi:hypothetical protein
VWNERRSFQADARAFHPIAGKTTMKLIRLATAAALCAGLAATARAQGVLFSEDFQTGLGMWSITHPSTCGPGLSCSGGVTWAIVTEDNDCAAWASPFPVGSKCATFSSTQTCNYDGGPAAAPTAEMRSLLPITLPPGGLALTLRFWSASDADAADQRTVEIDHSGLPAPVVLASLTSSAWQEHTIDLTPYGGTQASLIFRFQSSDASNNDGNGWLVDGVRVESSTISGFCSGDGTATACPCGNVGATGHGCASSIEPNGALLVGNGNAQVSADTVTLSATGLSNSTCLFFQGTTQQGGASGVVFGDGLRCAGGSVVRLATLQSSGGAAQLPGTTHPQLSVAGQIPPGGATRTYQVWYRNAAAFCTTSTFNLTNGVLVSWMP